MPRGQLIDLAGQRFGKLTVIERGPNGSDGARWVCVCECGETTLTPGVRLRRGQTSCRACAHVGKGGPLRHGYARRSAERTGAYKSWVLMLKRVRDPNFKSWADYGGRGITVCDRWLSFENFLADMGERPDGVYPSGKARYSIDRIDNEGNYEPGNCRWATASEQNANQRRGKKNQDGRVAA